MPPVATAVHLQTSGMPPATLTGPKPLISMCNSPRYSLSSGNMLRIYQYSMIKSAATAPNRTWIVLNDSRIGSRLSGFPSSAKKSSEDHGGVKGSSASEVKPTKSDRGHHKSASDHESCNPPAPVVSGGHPDLLKVPGVGPKTLTKLVENDITGVDDLKKIYKEKFSKKSSKKMIEYLQSVGIKNKTHAKSITTFVRKNVNQEMKDSVAMANNDYVIPATKKKAK